MHVHSRVYVVQQIYLLTIRGMCITRSSCTLFKLVESDKLEDDLIVSKHNFFETDRSDLTKL